MPSRARNTYTGYSVGCAVVWALILLVARRRLDPDARKMLERTCGAWWTGWTSATIARAAYPPPKPLEPEAERRLADVSLGLIALGFIGIVRLFASGHRPV